MARNLTMALLHFLQAPIKQPYRRPVPQLSRSFRASSTLTPVRKQVEALTGAPARLGGKERIEAALARARTELAKSPSDAALLRVELLRLALNELGYDALPAPSWADRSVITDPELARIFLLARTHPLLSDTEDAANRLHKQFKDDFRVICYRTFLTSQRAPKRYALVRELSETLMTMRPDRGEGYFLRALAESKQIDESDYNPLRRRALPFLIQSLKRPNRFAGFAEALRRTYEHGLRGKSGKI